MRQYQARVLRLCTALLANATEAEDAAQEAFIKAYRALASFRAQASFSTWLYRIAANHCKDLLRQRARHATESWEALLDAEGEAIHRLFATPSDAMLPVESADLIERLLQQLSPDDRMIVTLREVEGLSYQEIAKTLACTVDAVKARLRRARQELQEKTRHFLKSERV